MSDLTSESMSVYLKVLEKIEQKPKWWSHDGYSKGSLVVSESISSKSANKQCHSRMRNLNGVMEIHRWDDEEHFDAAVDTEEGPKNLKGTVVHPGSFVDVQSGAISKWQVTFQDANQAIREAYDKLIPKEAIKLISAIWEQLDRTSELAAARSRLLVGKLGKPKLAMLPKWFEDQRAKLLEADEGELAANPCAVTSAEFLVRASLAALQQNSDITAEIETGPMGRVIIDWCLPKGRL